MDLSAILLAMTPATSSRVVSALQRRGSLVDEVASREEALARLQGGGDVLIVLAGEDGPALLEFCRMVRAVSPIPLVVLSPCADDAAAASFGAGADLVLAEPLTEQFLREAIQALIRRVRPGPDFAPFFNVRGLAIDIERHEAYFQSRALNLTPFELRVLSCLAMHAGRVVTAQRLLQYAQGSADVEPEAPEVVKVHVHHLRRKLQMAGADGFIKTVRGFGYILDRRAATRPDDPLAGLFPPEEVTAAPEATGE